MKYNYLEFNMDIGRTKPENIINTTATCPFCNYDKKDEIIDRDGEIILIPNKYPVLTDSTQLLIIESKECLIDIPEYTREHMKRLMTFAFKHWFKMIHSGEYSSVLFFKNHGSFSGGTMRHPHMQIVGLKKENLSMKDMIYPEQFLGIELAKKGEVTLNLSTRPRVGFNELNIIMKDLTQIGYLAEFIQNSVDFIMNHYQGRATCSYNLFFYYLDDTVYVKIIPRYATSPLFIGYNIELIPNNLQRTAKYFKEIYYPDK